LERESHKEQILNAKKNYIFGLPCFFSVLPLNPANAVNLLLNDKKYLTSLTNPVRRGRPRKSKPDQIDSVVNRIIDSGDLEQYGRQWKQLRIRYSDKLPKGYSWDALRKKVEREEARRRGGQFPSIKK